MLRSDRILPAAFFAFLAFAYYQADKIPGKEKGVIGAAFFPKMVIIVMAVLLILIVLADLKKEKKEAGQGKVRKGVTLNQGLRQYMKVILLFVVTCIYVALLHPLGYVVDTILYLLIMTFLLKKDWKERLPFTISLMVIFTVATYCIFTYLLQVSMPAAALF